MDYPFGIDISKHQGVNDANVQDYVAASSFDIHFEIDSAGSDSEYTK